MTEKSTSLLLRIFLGEYDKYGHEPLYEHIVETAKKEGLAGATVTKGMMSFGATSRIHKSKLLALSEDLPIIVEIVDEEAKIHTFMETLDDIFKEAGCGGLITHEKIDVHFYEAAPHKK